jgi:DNA-binding SARP family transcriptional activator
MTGKLKLTLLGTPQVILDGTRVTDFAYQKSSALLAYLAVTGHYYAREALAGVFWGEATGPNARASLRKVLSDLRQKVPDHLIISRHEVAFDRAAPYKLDVEAFHEQIGQAIGLSHNPLTEEGAARLSEAVTLYQGDFMEGFHVLRAAAFEEWVRLTREWLRMLALQAMHVLAGYHASRHAYDQAIDYMRRMLVLEPAEEEVHQALMILLAFSGQRAAALRQYAFCCQALEELGAEPVEETRILHERIRDGTWERVSHTPDRNSGLGLFFPSSWGIM